MDVHQHPTPEQLIAFGLGRVSDRELGQIDEHLTLCSSCRDIVESAPPDTLVGLLQSRPTIIETVRAEPTGVASPAADRAPGLPPGLIDHPRYRVHKLLGVGGMGVVYEAQHRLLERKVAIKVLHDHLVENPHAIERFRQEVKAAARMNHPNIVTTFDADQVDDVHFLVMEYVDGETLAHVLEHGPMAVAEACDAIRQAALGLQHAFECGLVHRDLKPQNLMRTVGGQIKIVDFGLALLAGHTGRSAALTDEHVILGTPDYTAPEQAVAAHESDVRADIYSLGCTLYHLLAGGPPFPERTSLKKLIAHHVQAPRPLSEVRPDVPAEVVRVIDRMMAKNPADRYQTPMEVADVLTRIVAELRVSVERPSLPRGRRRLFIGLAILVLVTLVGCGVYWLRVPNVNHSAPVKPDKPQDEPVIVAPAGSEIRRFIGHKGIVISVAISRDGRIAATGGEDKIIRIWDVGTGKQLHELQGHVDVVRSLAVTADGKRLLSGSSDESIQLWDIEKATSVKIMNEHRHAVQAVAFSPDGKRAVSGSYDKTVRIWDLGTGGCVAGLEGHEGRVRGVRILADGRHAVSAGDDRVVVLWDTQESKMKASLSGHTDAITSLDVDRFGRFALTGSRDNTVRLWDLVKGREHRVFSGHTGPVYGVAFSRDGKYILSGSEDGTARIWNATTGESLHILKGHEGPVHGVAISGDGRYALTASEDGTARLWAMPMPEKEQEKP